jgi:hypothetical protein
MISYMRNYKRGHSAKFQWYGRRDVPLGKPVMYHVTLCEVLRYLDRYKYPGNNIFEFFLRFLGDLVPVLKANLEYMKNKIYFFTYSTGTKSPRNRRKNIKKIYVWGICTGPNTLFLDLKIFEKFCWLHLAPGTTFKKKFFQKTKVVPGTKYVVFWYIKESFHVILKLDLQNRPCSKTTFNVNNGGDRLKRDRECRVHDRPQKNGRL